MAFLDLSRLMKSYGASPVVKEFSLAVEKGEFISFLGPSGCGKTTTLRMVAGFERPDSGTIRIDGRDVTGLRPNQRQIGMVFQSYALFPNLTVAQNVGFGLKVQGADKGLIRERVAEMLAIVGLADYGARYPFQLSGGQQQRVALARALAPRPQVLLLDEPLSALDAKIRVSLRDEIRAIQRRLGITAIYVTHDQEEALAVSDRIVVMNAGRAEQVGAPHEIYNRPATRFVATFVGQLSMLAAESLGGGRLRLAGQDLELARDDLPPGPVTLALRPEMLRLGGEGEIRLPATIREVQFLGSIVRIGADLGGQPVTFDTFNASHRAPPRPGEAVVLTLNGADLLVLDP